MNTSTLKFVSLILLISLGFQCFNAVACYVMKKNSFLLLLFRSEIGPRENKLVNGIRGMGSDIIFLIMTIENNE